MGAMRLGRMAAVVAVAVMGAGAWGQVQVQQNNPLDANPQVGSGGSNVPVPGYAPVNGNDIVTGNVSGLKYFHQPTTTVIAGPNGSFTVVQNNSGMGSGLGTFSPYEFQGSQGSSDFFNFARASSGGSQTNIGQTQSYYLPSATVSTGQGSLYSAPYGNGFDSALAPRYAASPATPAGSGLRDAGPLSAGIALRQFSATPANPTPGQDISGNLTSPLFGVRAPENSLQPATPSDANGGPALPAKNDATPDSQNGNTDNNANTNNASPNQAPNSAGLSADARVKRQSTDTGNTQGRAGNDNAAQLAMTSTTYRTLLQRLQDAETQAKADGRSGTGETPALPNGQQANATNAPNGQNGTGGANGRPTPNSTAVTQNPTEGFTGRPVIDPLTGRPKPLKNNPGLPNTITPRSTDESPTAGNSAAARNGAMARSELENTPTETLQAGKMLPALKSLVDMPRGGKLTPFDTLMTDAEKLLKSGKYLEAADAYQTAITTEPDNALAVIGRAQAELGAGMYGSAANDLRFVFTRKPELMSVRYPVGEYIPAERQNYLIKDLLSLSTSRAPGNTASFLLCYIYYNTGRVEDAQAELGRWGNRAWADSWQGVATRAWGK